MNNNDSVLIVTEQCQRTLLLLFTVLFSYCHHNSDLYKFAIGFRILQKFHGWRCSHYSKFVLFFHYNRKEGYSVCTVLYWFLLVYFCFLTNFTKFLFGIEFCSQILPNLSVAWSSTWVALQKLMLPHSFCCDFLPRLFWHSSWKVWGCVWLCVPECVWGTALYQLLNSFMETLSSPSSFLKAPAWLQM